jgi:saccharopine dehydrogenase-like NADP-dependent oxidoreductase
MTGWCETIRKLVKLGWLNDNPIENFTGKTYGDLTRHFINNRQGILSELVAEYLGLETYSSVIKRFEWLGLFGKNLLPTDKNTAIDFLNAITLEKMLLAKQDRDMIVMFHEFIVEYENMKEYISSKLVDYGIPNEDSAIARTVAYPAAIAVKLTLNKKIKTTGVKIPIMPEIYNPILDELDKMEIKFIENTTRI